MKSKLLLVTAILLVYCIGYSESMIIAYIDTDKIMSESKDTQEAQKMFANEQMVWDNQIAELDSEIEKLTNDYENKKMILTESGKMEAEDKIEELVNSRQSLVQEIFGENGKAVQKNQELLEPILNKLKGVIEQIAIEDNYSIILDTSSGGVLYGKPGLDITEQVIQELDKAVE